MTAYDQQSLPVYAEMLDADDAGIGWEEGAHTILGLDIAIDEDTARRCWESHLARARWIIGEGLDAALLAFGEDPKSL